MFKIFIKYRREYRKEYINNTEYIGFNYIIIFFYRLKYIYIYNY